jgi:H+/gluconate symporter-like permease
MSNVASIDVIQAPSASPRWLPICSALEVVVVFAGIVNYIWRWHHIFRYSWIPLWGLVLFSHFLHRDTLRSLGLSLAQLRANAEVVLPIALAVYVPLFVFGFARRALVIVPANGHAAAALLGYGSWCAFQQYLAQSFFHNRLMEAVRNRHLSSVLVAIMFGATHLPNAILTVATLVAGFVFAEVFARHRNIWPLALAQAVGGLLVAAVSPASLIRNMRVGPGYFSFPFPSRYS